MYVLYHDRCVCVCVVMESHYVLPRVAFSFQFYCFSLMYPEITDLEHHTQYMFIWHKSHGQLYVFLLWL